MYRLLTTALGMLTLTSVCLAQNATVQASQDTWVGKDDPDATHGASTTMALRGPESWSDAKEAFVRFDLPAGSLQAAELQLYGQGMEGANDVEVALVPAYPGDVEAITWNTRPTTVSVLGTAAVPDGDGAVYYDLTGAVAPGTSVVLRLRLLNGSSSWGWGWFRAREHADGPSRPAIAIDYAGPFSIQASEDTWVGKDDPDAAHGSSSTIALRGPESWFDAKEGFLRFDVPPLATIDAVDLQVFRQGLVGANELEVALVPDFAGDVEDITWNTRPTTVTVLGTVSASEDDGLLSFPMTPAVTADSSIVLRVRLLHGSPSWGWGSLRAHEHSDDQGTPALVFGASQCGTVYCDSNPDNVADITVSGCECADGSILICMTNANQFDGNFSYLMVGQGNQTVTNPGGALGDLCLIGSCIGRYTSDAGVIVGGTFCTDVLNAVSGGGNGDVPTCGGNLCSPPGQTFNFQFWHRNGMNPSRFSKALTVTFE